MTVHIVPESRTPDGQVRRTFDADEVRRMVEAGVLGEDERVELVEGELLAMAAKGFAHDWVKSEVAQLLSRSLPASFRVAVECTVQLSRSVVLEPDVLVARRDDILRSPDGFASLDGSRILLAVEVAASSLVYDRGRKAALYARFGVPEYWVIDANERVAWVHADPSEGGYRAVVEAGRGAVLQPRAPDLAGIAVDLAALG
jgi:Uma2 family endonuclease